jgi:hypothetical protein
MLLFDTMARAARLKQSDVLFELLVSCAAVAVMLGGLIVRARLPVLPLADADTWGYLRPALSWLSGFGFQQTYGRDWLYPALLAGTLKVSGDFCAITYLQRFLGLAGIIIFWLAWRLWLRLLPPYKQQWRWVGCFLALLPLAVYALSPQQALLENTIRPEGMLAFFEMSYLYCLISFFAARWRSRRTGWAIIFGTATLVLSYAVLLLKPSWGFSFACTFFCVVAAAFGRTPRLLRFGPLLAGGAALMLMVSLPRLLSFQKDAQLFLPFTLVCIHAPQILETGTDAVSPGRNSGVPDSLFYEELGKAYRTARDQQGHYRTLGFDTDYIQYRSGFFSTIMQKEGWNDREIAAACYSAYFRVWLQNPRSMLQKIWKQIPLFLFPRAGDFYSKARSIDLNQEIAASRRFLLEDRLSPDVEKIYQSYIQRLEIPGNGPSHPLGFPILSTLAFYLARISPWLQVAFFAALAVFCLSRKGRAWRLAGLIVAAVLSATYGNVLTIAVVHSLDVVRYRVSYAPGFLLGLAMIANYLLALAATGLKLDERDGSSIRAETNFERTSGA